VRGFLFLSLRETAGFSRNDHRPMFGLGFIPFVFRNLPRMIIGENLGTSRPHVASVHSGHSGLIFESIFQNPLGIVRLSRIIMCGFCHSPLKIEFRRWSNKLLISCKSIKVNS